MSSMGRKQKVILCLLNLSYVFLYIKIPYYFNDCMIRDVVYGDNDNVHVYSQKRLSIVN